MNTITRDRSFSIKSVIWPTGFFVLTFVYYRAFHFWPHNSDDANSLLLGYDIFHGNPLLKNWYLPPDTFYATDVIPLGAMTLLFGLSARIMLLLPAMIWSTVVLVSIACAMHFAANRKWALLCVATILGFPVLGAHAGMELITRAPMHIATTLYALFLILMAHRWFKSPKSEPVVFFGFQLLLIASVFSDPFILYAGALPILLVCAHQYIAPSTRVRAVVLAGMIIASVIAGKLLLLVSNSLGGFSAHPQPMVFAAFSDLGNNFAIFVRGLMTLFGADFTGRELTPRGENVEYLAKGPIVMLSRVSFLLATAWTVWLVARRIGTRQSCPLIAQLLFYPIVVIVAATLLSNQLVDLTSARYSFPILIFGVILLAITVKPSRSKLNFAAAALLISAVSFACTYVLAIRHQ